MPTALRVGPSPTQDAIFARRVGHTVRRQVTSLMTQMACARQVGLVRKALRAP
ncbi:hypothetical protein [Variovorax sp. 54]|uniref:hypothetical protein n=1 Tax=Variovorax sp. 54 TaxID=2035212 RepID=UPI0015D51834|nr:hypothetical protein [Variovorax sp. 54]